MTVIEVAIGPGGSPGVFAVEVVASPAGEAKATVELDADALLARHGLLRQAVLASAVPSRRVLPETERPVREVGQALFAGLLGSGEVAGRYRASAAVAAERGEGLRVVVRIDSPALAGLPWEAMYDQAAGAYVCRQDQLVRHVPVASVPAPLQVRPPLRILGVVSSPRGLPPLNVEKEQDQLARALARPVGQGLAEVHWAPSATWADLQDLLLDGEWHVLHFTGHGDFDPAQDEGVLALVREDGRADLVAAHRLVDLLRQARPMPRLVVLNSCSGAAAGVSDLFSGTAAALVRGGVSAVAAMQYEISDPAAVAFARGFYAAIARGRGVDDAVSSGRVAILGTGDRTLEWVTPVLYLRGHDARLFTLPAPAEDRNREGTGSIRVGQPGDTISPGAAGRGPRGDSPGPVVLPQLASVLTDGQTGASMTATALDRPGNHDHPGRRRLPPSRRAVVLGALAAIGSAAVPAALVLSKTGRSSAAPAVAPVTVPPYLTIVGHSGTVYVVAFRPSGGALASSGGDRSIRLWDTATWAATRILPTSVPGPAIAYSPHGGILAIGDGNQPVVWLWDTARRRPTTLRGQVGRVFSVAFSPDGKTLASGSPDDAVGAWDVASKTRTAGFPAGVSVNSVAFNKDGRSLANGQSLAIGCNDGTVQLRDLSTGAKITAFQGRHAGPVESVAFSPGWATLASGGADHTIRLWDATTGSAITVLHGHKGRVLSVAFSPDGKTLASASTDTTIRLWDLTTHKTTTHKTTAFLVGHTGGVESVTFSPDGKTLASGSADTTIRLWKIP